MGTYTHHCGFFWPICFRIIVMIIMWNSNSYNMLLNYENSNGYLSPRVIFLFLWIYRQFYVNRISAAEHNNSKNVTAALNRNPFRLL